MSLASNDPRHGTVNGYKNLKCSCIRCREAWAAHCRSWREARRGALSVDDARHGKNSTYTNYGCRCGACSDANATYNRRLRGLS